jgi:Rab family protein
MNKIISIPQTGEVIKISFFDTAGEEKYHAVTACHYRKAVGAFLVYDVTSRVSFENIAKWLKDVIQLADPDCVIILLGNKSDIDASATEKY